MKTDRKERKVFISFLGASNYSECQYLISGELSCPVRYVQEAMLNHYSQSGEWSQSDKAYILLTNIAREKNWENDGHRDRDTHEIIKQQGLRERLEACNLAMPVEPIDVLPGNNETEIMTIFTTLFNLLQEGDELFFDITHGFRYLPIIALVLGNYSKFLKNVKVEWIGYGNFEDRDKDTNTAQVVDLTSMSMLQDWTTAAADFINNGNAKSVVNLTQTQLKPVLKDAKGGNANANAIRKMAGSLDAVVNDIKNCRGFNIMNACNVKALINSLNDIEDCMIEPLTPLLEKIRDSVSDFDIEADENIVNGFVASEWCLENNMTQQAATILLETVISVVCSNFGLNYKNFDHREIARSVMRELDVKSRSKHKNEDEDTPLSIVNEKEMIKNKKIIELYNKLGDLRNDLNHCGMRDNPIKAEKFKERIQNYHHELYNILIKG
mgnify:CR=1 FL=1